MAKPLWYLKGKRGDGKYVFEVLIDRDLNIGRDRYSCIPLVTGYASRRHCSITKGNKNGEFFIEDLNSVNGTFRNDTKMEVGKKYKLRENDEFMIGKEDDLHNSFRFKILRTEEEVIKKLNLKDISNTVKRSNKDDPTDDDIEVVDIENNEKLNKVCYVKMQSLSLDDVDHLLPSSLKLTASDRQMHQQVKNPKHRENEKKRKLSSSSSSSIASVNIVPKTKKRKEVKASTSKQRDSSPEVLESPKEKKKPCAKKLVSTSESPPITVRKSPRKTSSPQANKSKETIKRKMVVLSDDEDYRRSKGNTSKSGINGLSTDALKALAKKRSSTKTKTIMFIPAQALTKFGDEKPTASDRIASKAPSKTITATAGSQSDSSTRKDPRLQGKAGSVLLPTIPEYNPDPLKGLLPSPIIESASIHPGKIAVRPTNCSGSREPRRPVPVANPQHGSSLMMKSSTTHYSQNQHQSGPSGYQGRSQQIIRPKMNIDEYLERILTWNPHWLIERKQHKEEPPVVDPRELKPIREKYDSPEDYFSTQYPFILYEIFANLAEAFDRVNTFHFKECHVIDFTDDSHFTKVRLEFPVPTSNSVKIPQDGDIVVLEMQMQDVILHPAEGVKIGDFMGFGYVEEISFDSGNNWRTKPYNVPKGCTKIATCVIKIKRNPSRFILARKPAKVVRLEYIRPSLRLIEALLALNQSKLVLDVLVPRKFTCQMAFPREGDISSGTYNEAQNQAILGAAEAVNRGPTMPKIVFIQGPPGTGKTHTLIGMVEHIFKTWTSKITLTPKILICAPSNGAVDEIAFRLFEARNFLLDTHLGRKLKIVRMGQDEQVRRNCQHMTLERLVNDNLKISGGSLERVSKEKERLIEQLDIKISNLKNRNRFLEAEEAEREMDTLMRQVDRLRREQLKGGDIELRKKSLREDILRGADVILTTLNSCRSSYLERTYAKSLEDGGFNCVIIDEASQCSEPETLMPLYYTSISKMILIGDPMQLPATVKSVTAQTAGYGRSFFERVFTFFGEYNSENPIHMLNQQFRMHDEICRFPSREFYAGKLHSANGAGIPQDSFPMKPYIVIDVRDTHMERSDAKNIQNEGEASFVCTVVRLMDEKMKQGTTVGVITPYQGQKRLITDKISSLYLKSISVDVNTIDGFQGQERQVVIFSSVRSAEDRIDSSGIGFMGSRQRMNVALTRAKYGVVVCINRPALQSNTLWRSLIRDAESRNCLYQLPCTASKDRISNVLFNSQETKPSQNIR